MGSASLHFSLDGNYCANAFLLHRVWGQQKHHTHSLSLSYGKVRIYLCPWQCQSTLSSQWHISINSCSLSLLPFYCVWESLNTNMYVHHKGLKGFKYDLTQHYRYNCKWVPCHLNAILIFLFYWRHGKHNIDCVTVFFPNTSPMIMSEMLFLSNNSLFKWKNILNFKSVQFIYIAPNHNNGNLEWI